jgi:hypothetical protein
MLVKGEIYSVILTLSKTEMLSLSLSLSLSLLKDTGFENDVRQYQDN